MVNYTPQNVRNFHRCWIGTHRGLELGLGEVGDQRRALPGGGLGDRLPWRSFGQKCWESEGWTVELPKNRYRASIESEADVADVITFSLRTANLLFLESKKGFWSSNQKAEPWLPRTKARWSRPWRRNPPWPGGSAWQGHAMPRSSKKNTWLPWFQRWSKMSKKSPRKTRGFWAIFLISGYTGIGREIQRFFHVPPSCENKRIVYLEAIAPQGGACAVRSLFINNMNNYHRFFRFFYP